MLLPGARSRYRKPAAAVMSALCAGAVIVTLSARSSAADDDHWWSDYAGGPATSRYSPSKQITRTNVDRLQIAWTYPFGETGFNPIVARGTVYGRGRNGAIVALDASTGKEIWIHENMQGMTARGMNYWESADGKDRRLVFSMNDYLQEIDAATGLSIVTFGRDGVVDLREGLGRDPVTVGRIQSGNPGKVFENLILIGSSTGEAYMSPPGDLRAFDIITGKVVWQFHTVPHPGEFGYETWPKDAWKYIGGTNTWGEISIDARRGIAYFPIGSPTYDYYGADRPGANLFGTSLLALDARTGKRLWHFQMVHHDLWDYDGSAAPQLTTITHNGKDVDIVAMAGKTGFLYVFDRVTGRPIWPIEERPVPKSEMPGEQSWPTQPYPTNPPPFSKQTFTADDVTPYGIVTPEAREQFKQKLAKTRNQGLFTPIDFVDTLHIPGSNGGALFGYTAAEPTTGMVYVIGQDNPGLLRLLKANETPAFGPPGFGVYQRECSVCHGPDRSGTQNGPSLLDVPGRLDAEAIRNTLANGKGRMAAFPNLNDVDVENLVTFLVTPPGAGGGRGRGAGPAPTFPPGPVVASGGAQARALTGRGRGGPRSYPEGVTPSSQYVINAYGTIGTMVKPPFTTITKYDLNTASIKWQIGLGDDARLAAQGITGTGVTQMRSSLIVTAGGLIFAPGGDSKLRAYETDTGKLLWTSPAMRGTIRGGHSMYEIGGRQYVLVAASGETPPAGQWPRTDASPESATGYVAFALPGK